MKEEKKKVIMLHVDRIMIPGRDRQTKLEIAEKGSKFLAEEWKLDKKFGAVSMEDVPKEKWQEHMDTMQDKMMFVKQD